MEKDKIVKSITEVELSELKFPQIVIYYHPADWPEDCIARVFDNGKPTNVIMIASSLWSLQYDIEKNTSMMWCPRNSKDDTAIMGVYI